MAVKTAPGAEREPDGRVREGKELVSVLNGMTREEITNAPWPERDPRYGDYIRMNRHQMGVALLDGKTPSLLAARGTYKLMTLRAFEFQKDSLTQQWLGWRRGESGDPSPGYSWNPFSRCRWRWAR